MGYQFSLIVPAGTTTVFKIYDDESHGPYEDGFEGYDTRFNLYNHDPAIPLLQHYDT